MTRQAVSYRRGRVLLAGDAAHVHPPQGGQGLNIGVQDAVNLGWKLAQVVDGTSPETLLDTYHAERHPVGARVLHNTMAQVALASPDDRHQALRDTHDRAAEHGRAAPAHRRDACPASTSTTTSETGHPLLGRRMPDLDLHTADGPTRVFTLLHDARPVLLDLGAAGGFDISPWANRVRLVDATYDGAWELPVLGEVAAPAAVLIRPDGLRRLGRRPHRPRAAARARHLVRKWPRRLIRRPVGRRPAAGQRSHRGSGRAARRRTG